MGIAVDAEDLQILAIVEAARSALHGLRVDSRLLHMLDLIAAEDGTYIRGGYAFTVDGFDVSCSWDETASSGSYLYLQSDRFTFASKGSAGTDQWDISLDEMIQRPASAEEFSEHL